MTDELTPEDRIDQLNDRSFESFAAGFAAALEMYEVDADVSTDPSDLQDNPELSRLHYYYWDGRSKPLEDYLIESGVSIDINLDPGWDTIDPERFIHGETERE